MRRALPLALLVGGAVAACAGGAQRGAASSSDVRPEAPATCSALGPLVDLASAMGSSPLEPSSPLYALVDAEEELGRARAALDRVGRSDPELRSLLERVAATLGERERQLVLATDAVGATLLPAEEALARSRTCKGIDLRELDSASDPSTRKARLDVARSRACEPSVRLWAATKRVDLASAVSTASVAAQLEELGLDAERAGHRDRLVVTLTAHASKLRELESAAGRGDADLQALVSLRRDLSERIEETVRGCLGAAREDERGARAGDPRQATVMVRPTWSGALKTLGGASRGFGSGFFVRWTSRAGKTETLVVTNRHVMEGAVEADILLAEEVDAEGKSKEKVARRAELVASSPSDDVAVLRLRDAPGGAHALSLRGALPREQEVVVAAGFPGVGHRPSYQVTRGTVSNAHFGSEERDAGVAYLQHTAPIDPGNSGGPLLDERGRLVGMNTAKLFGRDSVSLAIPAARIRFALERSEERARPPERDAEVSCNVALSALSAETPSASAIGRFGLSPYEEALARPDGTAVVRTYAGRVAGDIDGPIDEARLRSYELLRAVVDAEGGVAPFSRCVDVAGAPSTDARVAYSARFRSRSGKALRATLREETGLVRLQGITRE